MKLLDREHGGMIAITIAVVAILAVLAFIIAGGPSPGGRQATDAPGTVTPAPSAVPSTSAGK